MSRRGGGSGISLGNFDEEPQEKKVDEPIIERKVRAARMWMGQFPPRVRNTFTLSSAVS